MTTLVLTCLLIVLISFLCSLSEAALLSTNPLRLEAMQKAGVRNVRLAIRLRQNVGRPIAAILILNTIANTMGSVIAGSAFDESFGEEYLWIFSVALTLVILFGCEILPKVIGVTYSDRLVPFLGPGIAFAITALRPVIWLTEIISRRVNPLETRVARYTADDISTLANLARQDNAIGADQEQIIVAAARLRTLLTQSIMVSRESIVFLRLHAPREQSYQTAQLALHTRYPVSETESPDGITGYVNYKEMLNTNPDPESFTLQGFVRPLPSVLPILPASELMKQLLLRRAHIALVKDEAGRVLGLVTLEDVLEELIGDIQDEFDWLPTEIVSICPGGWRAGGGAPMPAVAKALALVLQPGEESLTLDAWMQRSLGGPIRPKAMVTRGTARFLVNKVRRRHAVEVIVEARSEPTPAGDTQV